MNISQLQLLFTGFKILFLLIKNNVAERISENKNDINSPSFLYKSVYIKGINSFSDIVSNLTADIEEIIIEDSYINTDEESNDILKSSSSYLNLQSIVIKKSFIGTSKDWLKLLKNLESLVIIDSSFIYIINHSNNNITAIDLELNSFSKLKLLQISGGNISNIDISQLKNVPVLRFADNRFECGNDFTWLLKLYEKNKVDLKNAKCFMKKIDEKVSHPILYSLGGKSFIPVMKYKMEASENCPPKCVCELKGLLTIDRPQLNVDCIGLNMTKIPDVIPNGSSRCNFSYNFIRDLAPLYTNKLYDKVAMMALSHNYISHLDPVLFPELLKKRGDVGFWLDHNKLTKFPAASVKKVYDEAYKASFMPQFFLGHNPYICSCDYIGHFQAFIYQQMFSIFDARDIRCSDQDSISPGTMVLDFDFGILCSSEPILKTLIDSVNVILGVILVILLINYAHNYYQYRKHRKLPWIVTININKVLK